MRHFSNNFCKNTGGKTETHKLAHLTTQRHPPATQGQAQSFHTTERISNPLLSRVTLAKAIPTRNHSLVEGVGGHLGSIGAWWSSKMRSQEHKAQEPAEATQKEQKAQRDLSLCQRLSTRKQDPKPIVALNRKR